jgi:hypothetical protein
MIRLDALAQAEVASEPFPYLLAAGVLDAADLRAIAADFPRIDKPGLFPVEGLQYGPSFGRLIEAVKGPELAGVLGEKFGLDLASLPMMVTVRGHCQRKDGRIHTDSLDKLVSCLLYLNDESWSGQGGRLRFLRDGGDLESTIAEVPPVGGQFVAFRRTECSWHGHHPFEGPRRYVMFNWLCSDLALAKNVGRHKLSSLLKRVGLIHGDY